MERDERRKKTRPSQHDGGAHAPNYAPVTPVETFPGAYFQRPMGDVRRRRLLPSLSQSGRVF